MDVRLVIERGSRRKVLNLKKSEAVVGRSHGNTVRIPSSEVSRQHCRLLVEDGLVTVEDLGSVNGTFLNGQRIRGAELVRPGDTLEVGPVTFVVEYELTPEALNRLHNKDNNLDALAALADGEVLEALADGDVLERNSDQAVPVLKRVEEEDRGKPAALPIAGDQGDVKVDFDFDGGAWQMPEAGNLRDILSQIDEDEEPPARPPSPKKRK